MSPADPQPTLMFHTNANIHHESDGELAAPTTTELVYIERLFFLVVVGATAGLLLSLVAGVAFWWLG